MADLLWVYNEALGHLGSRRLSSMSEAREPKRALAAAYDREVRYCLEQANWNFASRTVSLVANPAIEPPFGFANAFQKPVDWLRTVAISAEATMRDPLTRYVDESGCWFCDEDPIYVRFVSLDPSWGLAIGRWPPSFAAYVSARLARVCCKRITGSTEMAEQLEREEKRARTTARATDAMNTPPAFPPTGSWVRSRGAGAALDRR